MLAAHLRDDEGNAVWAEFGLFGLAPYARDTPIAAMNHLIDDPQFPVSATFLETRARLQVPHGESGKRSKSLTSP